MFIQILSQVRFIFRLRLEIFQGLFDRFFKVKIRSFSFFIQLFNLVVTKTHGIIKNLIMYILMHILT